MLEDTSYKKYALHNPKTGAKVKCTEKYLFQWIARGFKISYIEMPSMDLISKNINERTTK